MVKVLINRRPVKGPWGGGNHFVRAFCGCAKSNGIELVESLSDQPHVIFIFHPNSEDGTISFADALNYKRENPATKLVIRVNECDARKATQGVDDMWKFMGAHSDHSFFVSKWMQEYYSDREWKCPQNSILINGVDREIFSKKEQKNDEKIRIVTHHWSSHCCKGEDIHLWLDEFVRKNSNEFRYTYIGRTNVKLPNATCIPPLFGKTLGEELGKHDVYISASRFDPGPNHVLEAIACGLPTYVHKNGGGCVEFADKNHVYETEHDLEKLLKGRVFTKNEFDLLSWETVMRQFCKIIAE